MPFSVYTLVAYPLKTHDRYNYVRGTLTLRRRFGHAPFTRAMQYWLGGSPENVESLLLNLAKSYVPDVVEKGTVKSTVSCIPTW